MPEEKLRALLDSLDLEGFEIGRTDEIALSGDTVGQAKGLLPEDWSLEALRTARTILIPAAILSSLGLQAFNVVGSPGVFRFASTRADETLGVRMPGAASQSRVLKPEKDPGVAWVDARGSEGFVIEAGDRRLVCEVEEDRIMLHEVVPQVNIPPLAEVAPPAWLAESPDSWLQDELARLVEVGGSWSTGVAAGLHARLTEPSNLGDPRDRVAALVRGESEPVLSRPRGWARSLSAEEGSTLESLALAEVDRLNQLADTLARSEPTSEGWADDWRTLCHGRDDVECVRVLLAERGQSASLDRYLTVLDREGEDLRTLARAAGPTGDERSRRVWLRDPDAWWGQSA